MKILHLTLKKKWFDLIASGQKKLEFRENKPYWAKRLVDKNGIGKKFDIVRFKNGYGPNVPMVDVEFIGIGFTGSPWFTPRHSEILWNQTIVIQLGKVLANNRLHQRTGEARRSHALRR